MKQSAGLPTRAILIVDDNDQVREMVAAVLDRFGWAVKQAASAEEAAIVMAADNARIALALVDVILYQTDGLSLARMLRTNYPHIQIVLLSGQLSEESRWRVSEEGFRFLPKPFTLEQLRGVVTDILGSPGPKPV